MLTFTAQGRIEVYLNGVLISRHVQEREAVESISRHGGIGTYEVVYPKVLVRKVERVSRETYIETGTAYGSGMAVEVVRRIVDTTAPSVGSLTAYGMTTSQVSLTWSDTGASYYELYKSLDGTNWGFLTTTADIVYTDTGLSAGIFYYYRYRAVDQTGNKSAFSATVAPIFPSVPTSLTVTGVTGTTITLDWADNSHPVSNYKVYRSINGTTYSLIASPTSSTYPDSGLSSGQIYYYKVSAVTAYGESAQSSSVSQTTTATGPNWIQSLPAINFVRGTQGQTFDFYPTYLNTNNAVSITVETGTLPSEIRIISSPTPRLAYDGTGTGSISSQVSFRVSASAQADWQSRISGTGVVWYHDFDSAAEVNNFRWTNGFSGGNDPADVTSRAGTVIHDPTGGVNGGGCLQIIRRANAESSDWWRPFSPIVGSGNGRGVDDPGANGTITARSYSPTSGGSQIAEWIGGYFGHSTYASAEPTNFIGTEYYLQMRIKMDPRRTIAGNTQVGKLLFNTITRASNVNQEIVTYSGSFPVSGQGQPNYFRMYGGNGTANPLEDQEPRPGSQPNSDLANYGAGQYCDVSNAALRGYCWAWSGGWDTIMYHIRPGREGVSGDAFIQVYAAHEGETTYTKIWEQTFTNVFSSVVDQYRRYGYNAMQASVYQGATQASEFWHKYDQIILSTSFINCPQA